MIVDCWVTLTTWNQFLWSKWYMFPINLISHNFRTNDFLNWLWIHTSNQISWISTRCKSGRFSWWRNPTLTLLLCSYLGSETLSLLHSLNKGLNTTSKFFSKLISWNIICWICSKCTTIIFFFLFRFNIKKLRLGSLSVH